MIPRDMVSLHLLLSSAAATNFVCSLERMVSGFIGSAGQYDLYFLSSPGLRYHFWEVSAHSMFSLCIFKVTRKLSKSAPHYSY